MKVWVNAESTVLVRQWEDEDTMEVATRDEAGMTWGPPIKVEAVPHG